MDEKCSETEEDYDCHEIAYSRESIHNHEDKSFKAAVPQIFAAVSAATYHIVGGMCLSFPTVIIAQLFEEQPAGSGNSTSTIIIDKEYASWFASSTNLVAMPSALVGGFLMDTIGRLNLIRLGSLPTLIGWILVATAQNTTMLMVGRILTGIPFPWGTASGAVYITEISSPHLRGSLVSFNSFFISLGFLLTYAAGSLLHWRMVSWICMASSILPIVLLIFVPESPSWLIIKGRNALALKSLKWFNKYQNESLTQMQYNLEQKRVLLNNQEKSQTTKNGVVEKAKLFLNPTCYKPLLIMFALFFLQQFSGIYMTLVYAVNYMQAIGADVNPYIASVYLGAARFGTAIANVWFFRYFKRRHMLFVGTLGMSATMAVSGMFTNWIHNGKTTYTWVPITMPILYVIFSMIGLLSLPFLYGSELFPLEVRGIAQSISISFSYIIIFVAIKYYFVLEDFLGGAAGLQYYFAAMSLAAFIFVYIFIPETHKKKLSEIENYFRNHTIYLLAGKKYTTVESKKEARTIKQEVLEVV